MWVLSQQVGADIFAAGLAGVILVALTAWLAGQAQSAGKFGASALFCGVALLASLGVITTIAKAPAASAQTTAATETYSPERVQQLRAEGRPVFVNFTAAWCITCLMNERVALGTPAVKQAFADQKIAYLKADWTNRDAGIAKSLAGFGRSGVPLYVFYGKGSATPQILPQLLTPGVVLEAFKSP